jgi:hypothetical protein
LERKKKKKKNAPEGARGRGLRILLGVNISLNPSEVISKVLEP